MRYTLEIRCYPLDSIVFLLNYSFLEPVKKEDDIYSSEKLFSVYTKHEFHNFQTR